MSDVLLARQKAWLHGLAARIAEGQSLSVHDRDVVAQIVRLFADTSLSKPRRGRGRPPTKIADPVEIARHFAALVHGRGIKPMRARSMLAEANDVTDDHMADIIAMHGDDALRLIKKKPD